jgi:hypothetical protein
MTERPKKTFYLTDEAISKLRSSAPFSNMTEKSQETLEEFLQSAFGGMNRIGKKLLVARLEKARGLLSHEEEFTSWPQLKTEIESMLSMETTPPSSNHPREPRSCSA